MLVLTNLHWNKEVLEKRSLISRWLKTYPSLTGTQARARFFDTLKFSKTVTPGHNLAYLSPTPHVSHNNNRVFATLGSILDSQSS